MKVFVLIIIMSLTTYLLRMVPFLLCRKEISSPFLKELFYYLPYAILAAMTFPAILYCCDNFFVSAIGLAAALFLAFKGKSLVEISLCTTLASLVLWIAITFL